MKQRTKTWLLLPMLAYSKFSDGTREFSFGWLGKNFGLNFKSK